MNESSIAIVADIENRTTQGRDLAEIVQKHATAVTTLTLKVEKFETTLARQKLEIDNANVMTKKMKNLEDRLDAQQNLLEKHVLKATVETSTSQTSAFEDTIARLTAKIDKLEGRSEPDHGYNTPSKDAFPDAVQSTPESKSEKIIPFGSRVLVKNGIMKETRVYIMNVTSFEGRNLYHAQTTGQTDMFLRDSEVLTVIAEGDKNTFPSGYDPTRSLEIFEKHITSVKQVSTPVRKQRSNHKSQTPASGSKTFFSANKEVDSMGSPRKYAMAPSNPHDLDDEPEDNYYNRPLADYEYIYPTGTAAKRVFEDKVEAVHESIKVTLSDETKIQSFYEETRRRLQPQNIPLKDWLLLTPSTDLLDLPRDMVQNYDRAKLVMSRAIYNLFDANKDTLITDLYMRGELNMFKTDSDGFGFLRFMISQNHPKFRHTVSRPSIIATLQPPIFTDDKTIYEFCSEVHEYMTNGNAPDHFTPLAAAQFVAESIRKDTRFDKGRINLETEILKNTSTSGYVPAHLTIRVLSRTILEVYDHDAKRDLSKPKRTGTTQFNKFRTFDLDTGGPVCVGIDEIEEALKAHRVDTRSGTRDRNQGNQRYKGNGNGNQQYRNNGNADKSKFGDSNRDARSEDRSKAPFKQCGACGQPGHDEEDCRKKLSFVRLSQWLQLLSPAQRKEFSRELDRNARDTHEKYKKAYGNRREIRKKINVLNVNDEARIAMISVFRAQLPDIDFGSLDLDFIDDSEPILEYDPETDELSE